MTRLLLDRITKRFDGRPALDAVTLEVEDGAFVALLGPSGCGKSTLLRVVAGFERPDAGTVRFGDQLVSGDGVHVPTEARRLGMVFQSYALWPHMTVAENVGFALRVAGLASAERRARTARALATVGLERFADQRPAVLSGGQRQRVALARTLAAEPQIVLLDEPLANLDANLRESMQEEIQRFRTEARATMLFVTHDQAEALALADRVAVMMAGRLRQIDRPRALYDRPADAEVARFIGRGAVVPAMVRAAAGGRATVRIGAATLEVRAPEGPVAGPGAVSLRPENCRIVRTETGEAGDLVGQVISVRYTGPGLLVAVALEDGRDSEILATAAPEAQLAPGDRIAVRIVDGWLLPASVSALARA